MKKWIILGFAAFVMIFQFQNCEQGSGAFKTNADSMSMQVNSSPRVEESTPGFDLSRLVAIDSYSSLQQIKYRIDMTSLNFKLMDDNGNLSAETYCLSDDEKQALDNALYHARLCAGHKPADDQACAMVYSPPYARLVNDQETLALGEGVSSCETGPDLCDEASQNLRDLLDSLNRSFLQQGLTVRACQ